ncbi:hypothetical protein [Burkholderia vietnamiensis]|uniref:hypothetical protein n=1 Tax=Burkholderia vietnamiensis TaxID=60552 RepID=UPI001CAB0666|nr:hypothetical protein [Burkholderia vietnamiensis]CAG9228836.1 conserved hypothetical protein [Burkholderia vietnamiensis]HDR9086364.1 hypothetical protein [Burkholderia vietnamiensis]
MKIRMVQAGYEKFTGLFGGVQFEDGESAHEVDERTAARLANIVRIEREDGSNPSASQLVLDIQSRPMAVAQTGAPTAEPIKYSQGFLEQVASERGIKGLREIGDTLGVKATGIADLIRLILEKQGVKLEVEPIPPVAAPEGPEVATEVTPAVTAAEAVAPADAAE